MLDMIVVPVFIASVSVAIFISTIGASRTLTVGFGSRWAAVVLVSVGSRMHGQSHGDAWQC